MADLLLDLLALVGFFALSFSAAAVGTRYTVAALGTWYAALRKPSWTPSGRTIGAVWTVLYALMAIAAWIVWREAGLAWLPLSLFVLQLVLNAAWSWLFFGRRDLGGALAEIVVLWFAVLATAISFWMASPLAGLLFAPYLAWVVVAGNLNRILLRMNPD